MVPDGKLVSHPGILYRRHAEQIAIYGQGNLQVIGNTDIVPSLAYPNLQLQSAGRLCLLV